MDLDEIQFTAEEHMEKSISHLKSELRGIRTGRASTALVDFIKVDYYGSPTEIRQIALVTVAEATQIVIKPYAPSDMGMIVKGIQASGLGLNPMTEGKQIRISIPPLSGERRTQLVGSIKQMGEQAKIAVRNARRNANKHVEQLLKEKKTPISEDDVEAAKEQIQELLKKYEGMIDEAIAGKTKDIQEL